MATAYAAFTSLMHLIADLHEHPYPPIKLDEEQVDSLNSKISFFQRFLEDNHKAVDHGLEIRIADAAYAAEDLIDARIADRVLDQSSFDGRLQKVIEGIDLVEKEAMKMNPTEQSRGNNQSRRHRMPLASSQPPSATSGENIVVGIEDKTINIVDKLTSQNKSGPQIISISGMGGIGKTTLARKVYDNSYVKYHFDICAWATISKDYNTHESLVEILHCLDKTHSKESLSEKSEHLLGDKLHKYLYGRRYLVILDDVWDVEAWNKLRIFFPHSRGSGIVITTREEATVASISSHDFAMDFLDESESWDLFCKSVFGQDSCPRELEDVGKDIANKCRGLPLSIVLIGGHLTKSPRTREYWKYIPDNVSSVVNSEDDGSCLKTLSLSYNHLPIHLKPCFLYMAIFPEDEEIPVSQLIRLWVAEGFLKPINGKSLEEAAEDYLNDLIRRNLVLAFKSSQREKIKVCKIHDLLRDLCLKEASKTNFLCIARMQYTGIVETPHNERRIVVRPSEPNYFCGTVVLRSLPRLLRTLMFHNGILLSIACKSLRVLSLASGHLRTKRKSWVNDAYNLVNLRCLRLSMGSSKNDFKIPPSIALFWNLQSLDLEVGEVKEALDIWRMPQLRHIKIDGLSLSDPPSETNGIILKNLQSAKLIINFSFTEDLVRRVPNIKKLHVAYDEGAYSLNNIACLEKLESFSCKMNYSIARNGITLSKLTFPLSLKKLLINYLHLEDVTTKIGSLPQLEVLHLSLCFGQKWTLFEGQFVRLKYLKLDECSDLECFTADNNHFPHLQELGLRFMFCLKEISSDIGDITTLRSIELYRCPDSAVVSAKEMAEHQYQMGNEELQVNVRLRSDSSISTESTVNFHVRH